MKGLKVESINMDRALEVLGKMPAETTTKTDLPAMTIYTGEHPDLGQTIVVMGILLSDNALIHG